MYVDSFAHGARSSTCASLCCIAQRGPASVSGVYGTSRYFVVCCVVLCMTSCVLPVTCMQNDQGIVTHYAGIQTDVSAAAEAGLLDSPEQMTEQRAAGGPVRELRHIV